MSKKSIKDLASKLKNGEVPSDLGNEQKIKEKEQRFEEGKVREGAERSTPLFEKKNNKQNIVASTPKKSLTEVIEESNNREYQLNASVYVDKEIHAVIRRLKGVSSLKVGNFISHILEGFILEHLDEIGEVLNKEKKNKFLDK